MMSNLPWSCISLSTNSFVNAFAWMIETFGPNLCLILDMSMSTATILESGLKNDSKDFVDPPEYIPIYKKLIVFCSYWAKSTWYMWP